jgi:hypothetical protein
VSVKYVPNGNTKVVIDKVTYQNNEGKIAVLPVDKLGKDEIGNLLKRKLIKALDIDEAGAPVKKPSGAKPKSSKKNPDNHGKTREELVAETAGLGLAASITDATTVEEIQQLIEGAKA